MPSTELLITGSMVLGGTNQLLTWAIARKWRPAWLIMVVLQAPNLVYDLDTRQYGFAVLAVIAVWVGVSAWRQWAPRPGMADRGGTVQPGRNRHQEGTDHEPVN